MDASGLPPAAIAIELTESILLEKNEKAQNFLKELKQAGLLSGILLGTVVSL